MTKLYKKNGGTFIETNWTLEELERTAEIGAAYFVEALNLRQEKADLEYKLKCREDELVEISATHKKDEQDWLSQKQWYEGEIEALEAENQLMQEQLENKEETKNENN